MAQVKKEGMREAILESAFDSFCRKGYVATTMAEIARGAGMTVANLYVYFDSKLAILYAIYRPWFDRQLDALATSMRRHRSPRLRVRRLLVGLWGDIPSADHSFANALIEALASAPEGTGKSDDLLAHVERFLADLIAEAVPEGGALLHGSHVQLLSHILWMAFDGFVVNRRIGDVRPIEDLADAMTDLLLGPEAGLP